MTEHGPSDEHRPAVAMIGGGASGVLAAVHFLAAPAAAPARFLLFERSGKVGAGAAFSTPHQSHVLNVPAGGMSAFKEDPGHFARWLDRKGHLGGPDDFVPRQRYHSYLRDTLRAQAGSNKAGHVLEVRSDEVVDIEPAARGALIWPARAGRSEPTSSSSP